MGGVFEIKLCRTLDPIQFQSRFWDDSERKLEPISVLKSSKELIEQLSEDQMRVERVPRGSRSAFWVPWHRSILPILTAGEGEGGGVNPSLRLVLWFFNL